MLLGQCCYVLAVEDPILVKILPVFSTHLFIVHILQPIHLGGNSLIAPLKGISGMHAVLCILIDINSAYIVLTPHNLQDSINCFLHIFRLIQLLKSLKHKAVDTDSFTSSDSIRVPAVKAISTFLPKAPDIFSPL